MINNKLNGNDNLNYITFDQENNDIRFENDLNNDNNNSKLFHDPIINNNNSKVIQVPIPVSTTRFIPDEKDSIIVSLQEEVDRLRYYHYIYHHYLY